MKYLKVLGKPTINKQDKQPPTPAKIREPTDPIKIIKGYSLIGQILNLFVKDYWFDSWKLQNHQKFIWLLTLEFVELVEIYKNCLNTYINKKKKTF